VLIYHGVKIPHALWYIFHILVVFTCKLKCLILFNWKLWI